MEHINTLATKARAASAPVVFIQHETVDDELAYHSVNWQLQPELQVKDSDLKLRKKTADSFLRTELQELLAARDIEQVVICGYASEFCVDSTVRSAAALGYSVVLVADAHTTHDKPHATGQQIRAHENATLQNIGSFDGKIKALTTAQLHFAA